MMATNTTPYRGTKVQAEKSQSDIKKMLKSYGATMFQFGEAEYSGQGAYVGEVLVVLEFIRAGLKIRVIAPYDGSEREERRIWRVLYWGLKARMEAVDHGVETFEQAFLSHIVNPATNETIYEELRETGRVELMEPLKAIEG
jgi:hypothetical protein